MLGRRMLLDTERGYHVMLPQPNLAPPGLARRSVGFSCANDARLARDQRSRIRRVGVAADYRRIRKYGAVCETRDAAGRGTRDVDLDGFSAVNAGHASILGECRVLKAFSSRRVDRILA